MRGLGGGNQPVIAVRFAGCCCGGDGVVAVVVVVIVVGRLGGCCGWGSSGFWDAFGAVPRCILLELFVLLRGWEREVRNWSVEREAVHTNGRHAAHIRRFG